MSLFKTFRLVPAGDSIRGEQDEWSGISDAKERKRRQNRINQRAARRRRRLNQVQEQHQIVPRGSSQPAGSHSQLGNGTIAMSSPARVDHTETYFPLTRDAQLLHVITLNVSRAILANYVVLSSVPLSTNRFCSIRRVLSLPPPIQAPMDGLTSMAPAFVLPPSLMPTLMQQQVPHYGWIDLFPSPQLRDNLIVALKRYTFDEDAFMMDVLGDAFQSLCSGAEGKQGQAEEESKAITGMKMSNDESKESNPPPLGTPRAVEPGLVSWSDPWDVAGWEVTEEFIQKWGFLLQGCRDVVIATNIWRERRGDEPLTCSV